MARTRYGRRGARGGGKPIWLTLPLWLAIGALIVWGLWQLGEFRKMIYAGADAALPPNPPAATQTQPTQDTAAGAPADPTTQAAADPTPTDPWIEATTPATFGSAEGVPPAPATTTASTPTVAVDTTLPNTSAEEISQEAADLAAEGARQLDAGRMVEGRAAFNAALSVLPTNGSATAERLREELSALNVPVFLGTAVWPEDPAARYAEIQPGDSYARLAHRYAIPSSLIATLNPGLNPRNLKVGTGIKIVQGPFNLRLIKQAHRLDLFARDLYVRSFAATLEEGNFLPHGTYRMRSDSKIAVGAKMWDRIEGADDTTREVTSGWLYGTAGMRSGDDHPTGLRLADEDLAQLYNVLVEMRSVMRVEP